MSTTTSATSAPESWEAKVARLRGRKVLTESVVFPDAVLEGALREAAAAVRTGRAVAREKARVEEVDAEEVDAFIEDQVADLMAAAREAEAAAVDARIVFTFRNLPPDVYDAFEDGFPPTESQKAENLTVDAVALTPAMIAECSVDGLTVEAVNQLKADAVINLGELAQMLAACRKVNEQARSTSVNLGKE